MADYDALPMTMGDIEAMRASTREVELEGGLSVNDWAHRVQVAVSHAHRMARAGESQLEYDAWVEAAAICAGRAEQIARHMEANDV